MAAKLLKVGWSAGLSLVDKYVVAADAELCCERMK
jgi:hypothetical protein